MGINFCEDCSKCDKIVNDNIVWYICNHYDTYIERIKSCKFKE